MRFAPSGFIGPFAKAIMPSLSNDAAGLYSLPMADDKPKYTPEQLAKLAKEAAAKTGPAKVGIGYGPPIPIDPSTTVDKRKVAEWLSSHWKDRHGQASKACPVCGESKWAISEDFGWIATIGPNQSLLLGGPHFPFVVLTCTVCGNTLLFNALVMGMMSPPSKV